MEEKNPQQNNPSKLKTVRTYMSDMADTVRANEISVIKVALAEQNRNEREDLYRKAEGTPTKKVFWILGSLILIGGAIYGSYYLSKTKEKINTPQQITREESIISYDEIYYLDLTSENSFISKIKNSKLENKKIVNKNDSIKFISLSREVNAIKEKISVRDFFTGMEFTAPSSLIRSLSDDYMVGTYTKNPSGSTGTTDSTPRLFMIFQSKDYEFSYAGMLEWEKIMGGNMYNIFDFNTSYTKTKINERDFKDVIIANKDSRILYNENEKPLLYYMFTSKNYLIITDSIEAIREISSRLIIKNIKPL